jgi:protein required for attachment to host cells
MMTKTWILIADAHHAEIWTRKDRQQPEEAELVEPSQKHRFSREIGSDRPGRAIASSDNRHAAVQPREDLLEAEHRHFARALVKHLRDSLANHEFDRLAIIAAPKMLGLLRDGLDQKLAKALITDIAKDLVKLPPGEIRGQILALIP